MARKIKRGDIYFADLEPTKGHEQKGHRPVLIISIDSLNKYSGTVIALAITSSPQKAGYPLTYYLGKKTLKKAWVKINQIRTLSIERLGRKITHFSKEEMNPIIEGLLQLINE